MAILKDLIVHGSSRFLNKIYASEIQTPLIEAEAGIIKKLKADDVTVVGLLDVQGQMHTSSWTNSNIATIDGSFYITPTLSSSSGTVSFSSAAAATFTGSYAAVSSLYIGNNTASTVQWTSGSKILITGEVQVDGEWIPLGTLLGTLNSNNPTTSMPVVSITDNRNNTSAILTDIYSLKGNTSLSYRNLKVSLYQRADSSKYYPLGIFMTALGQNGKTFLDIYGGVNELTTSYGGYANPNVRIGNLSGLPAITTAAGNFTPVGWGIYTTNGYFSGTIVSNTGVIGGWKLGASSLYNGTTGLNNNTVGIYLGTDGIRNYSTSTQYVNITGGKITAQGVDLTGEITASSGSIGGWNIGTDTNKSLYYGNQTPGATTTNLILSPTSATNSNAIGGSGTGLKWFISAGKVFGVTTAGALYATSGKIGGWTIGTSSLYNSKSSYNNSNEGLYLGTDYIAGGAGEEWWFKKDGSAKIGAMTLSAAGVLSVPAANISGQLTAATIDASKISSGDISSERITTNVLTALQAKLTSLNTNNLSAITANLGTITTGVIKHDTVGGTNGIWFSANTDTSSNVTVGNSTARKDWRLLVNNKFGVTKTGDLYASSANISGTITATGGTIGGINIDNNGNLAIGISHVSGLQDSLSNAAMTATSYISYINASDGITVHNAQDTFNYLQLNSTAISMYRVNDDGTDSDEVLRIDDTGIRIGKNEGPHFLLTNDKLAGCGDVGNVYFEVGKSDNTTIQLFYGNGERTGFEIGPLFKTIYYVKKNDITLTEGTDYEIDIKSTWYKIYFKTAPTLNSTISVTYKDFYKSFIYTIGSSSSGDITVTSQQRPDGIMTMITIQTHKAYEAESIYRKKPGVDYWARLDLEGEQISGTYRYSFYLDDEINTGDQIRIDYSTEKHSDLTPDTVTENYIWDATYQNSTLLTIRSAIQILSVSVNNTVLTENQDYTLDGLLKYGYLIFYNAPAINEKIEIKFAPEEYNFEYYPTYFNFSNTNLENSVKGIGAASFGSENVNKGIFCFIEGSNNIVTGYASHVEGSNNVAAGSNSHVGGSNSLVLGQNTFAYGDNLQATYLNSAAFGHYNSPDNQLFSVGKGGYENAFSINKDGNIQFGGRLLSGTTYENKIPLFKIVEKIYTSHGVGANGGFSIARDITIAGYKPIAILGFSVTNMPGHPTSTEADASWCVVPRIWVGYDYTYDHQNYKTDSLYYYFWNLNTSKRVNVQIGIKILYIAKSAYPEFSQQEEEA